MGAVQFHDLLQTLLASAHRVRSVRQIITLSRIADRCLDKPLSRRKVTGNPSFGEWLQNFGPGARLFWEAPTEAPRHITHLIGAFESTFYEKGSRPTRRASGGDRSGPANFSGRDAHLS